jgi:hypothetical protein
MKGALQEKKEMILVMEKTEVLKVEREIILLKKTMEKMKMQHKNPSLAFNKCAWAQKVHCILPELAPMNCQKNDCDKLVHHLCQSE